MTSKSDPFKHHPELRDRISDPETSFFRNFSIENVIKIHPQLETIRPHAISDEKREAIRLKALDGHTGDLWVFAYGSLMWDPAFHFEEVRRVYAEGVARRFILVDDRGGRGTKDAPGLMAALDQGDGCEGLAYRIAAHKVAAETDNLFRREMIFPGYSPVRLTVAAEDTTLSALTFLADHSADEMRPDITRTDQIRMIATGQGILGTSLGYLSNVVTQLGHLDIDDTACSELLHGVEAYMAQTSNLGSAQ